MRKDKVQTNVTLSHERAAALDLAAAIEQKDKAAIVEEALRLREELMGTDYRRILEQALAYRGSTNPQERLRAIAALRDEVEGATEGGSPSVEAALATLRSRSHETA